ncbi:autoinducer 2 ABC transporter permease LsrC [Thalassospira lucentensis]|uniref:Autoinducer 2 import system permease protein LsrC n=1 Tax=Thalassospira lucentensis TaxID=168935 RepID=A0A358HVE8_9PROT|nr:autoinducer 2 ABC transporter permease LsrC [Thalassospira lucentensis]HBU99153.1 autoinducer 2 ABC transporter permease LsrC [Thalassospira lucentensis]HCW66850.1 autoinducer 2 ABC transporter permease LsrC [Thalassospira lucentensis]|tara:strand:- start:66 stop:1136 length:1071 start_codon:yes stop_codon:yes gene_type:complete
MLDFFARNRVATLCAVTVLAFMLIGAAAPGYLSLSTASVVMSNSLVLMSVALGTMLVILTRNIDVSSGSVLGLSAVVLGLMLNDGHSLGVAITACLVTGAVAGLINGLLVTMLNVPSIIATLGTLGLFRGVMLILTGGNWIEELPQSLKGLAINGPLGISILTVVVVVALVVVGFCVRQTRFGRYFYAVGDNREASRHLGIPVKLVQIAAFVAAGILAAIAGMIFAAQIGFIPNQAGNGLELKAIAANVLGGVSLLGGTGTVPGIFVGVIFLTSIDSALVFLKIPAFWNDFIAGAVLLLVLLLDGRVRMAVDRAIRAKRYAVHHHGPSPTNIDQPDTSNPSNRDGASASRPQEAGE